MPLNSPTKTNDLRVCQERGEYFAHEHSTSVYAYGRIVEKPGNCAGWQRSLAKDALAQVTSPSTFLTAMGADLNNRFNFEWFSIRERGAHVLNQ
jgi:hypothetical protein